MAENGVEEQVLAMERLRMLENTFHIFHITPMCKLFFFLI